MPSRAIRRKPMSSDLYKYGPKTFRMETDDLPPENVKHTTPVKVWFADGETAQADGKHWTIDDWSWQQHGFGGDIVAYAVGPEE